MVATMDATVAGINPEICFGGEREQFRRHVGPEAAASGETRHAGVDSTGNDQSTRAFEDDAASCIAGNRPIFTSRAQEIFLVQKGVRKTVLLIIRVVITLAHSQSHCIKTGCFLNQSERLLDQEVQVATPVQHPQDFRHQMLIQLRLPMLGDIPKTPYPPHRPAFDTLWNGISLKYPAVFEFQHIEAFRLRLRV